MRWGSVIARKVSGGILAVLLLVPLVASGHHHAADSASAASCALCVVAHHAPAAVGAQPAPFALTLAHVTTRAPARVALPTRIPSPVSGRAPPGLSSPLAIS